MAIDSNGAIGYRQNLLFYIKEDLRRFKKLTTGNTIVMGRRTFESLPKGALPDRRNIVVTRNPDFSAPGAETAPSLEDALRMASDSDTYIIGGGQIYAGAMDLADTLEITRIHRAAPQADTFFPEISPQEWEKVAAEDHPEADPPYSFETYRRKT